MSIVAISKVLQKYFDGEYLGDGMADSAQICKWRCPTLKD